MPKHLKATAAKTLTPARRAWLYGIALAALPLLTVYGIVTKDAAPLWAALAGAVLVPGVALAHTPVKRPRSPQSPPE